jgi:hypothetical protein
MRHDLNVGAFNLESARARQAKNAAWHRIGSDRLSLPFRHHRGVG